MSEKHPGWDAYTTEAEESPMLAPEEVRRLGNRRRTRRHVGVAGSALALALFAGSALAWNTDLFGGKDPQWAGTPSGSGSAVSTTAPTQSSTSPSASSSPSLPQSSAPVSSSTPSSQTSTTSSAPSRPTLTVDNLPTGNEIYLLKPNDLGTEASMGSIGGRGEQTTISMCELPLTLGFTDATKAEAVFGGAADINNPDAASYGNYEVLVGILEFESRDRAVEAHSALKQQLAQCTAVKQEPRGGVVSEPTTVKSGATIDYFFVSMANPENAEEMLMNDVLLVLSGNRVLVQVEFKIGQDNDCVGPYGHDLPENEDLVGLCTAVQKYPTILQRLQS